MLHRRVCLILTVALMFAGSALAQTKQPPLRTGVDGTFAPHAMPKLGGGIEGFQVDLFTEVARRMKREITIDAVSFSTLIPGMLSGRYDFIAAGIIYLVCLWPLVRLLSRFEHRQIALH